ncbi:MAG TPA: Spy/CpxP family protein refolding chaperone [Blastocatellia bacterium]|nr:Spy/CpxP family protein refolding chaperone [Blastocatellia bacterium]
MRKLNKIQATAVAFIMAIALAVPVVLAQTAGEGSKEGRGGKWGHRDGRGGDRLMGRGFGQLDLTDAQKAQMKQIRETQQQTLQPLKQELRAKRQEIRKASEGGAFDEALVRQKLTEIAPLEAKLMAEQFRAHQEMLSVLTPEQRSKLDQMREQFKSKRGERGSRNRQTSL